MLTGGHAGHGLDIALGNQRPSEKHWMEDLEI